MAYVKIKTNRNIFAIAEYVLGKRDIDDPLELNDCSEGFVVEQFIATQMVHGVKENFKAFHIIQAFNEEDSKKLAPDEYTKIGRKMIEEMFPGYQFAVVTHTDKAHIHNHIMLNPVNLDTGERIWNKIRHVHDLRNISDSLCIEKGLSIIESQSKEAFNKAPKEIQDLKKRGGFSYVLDLREKAEFARGIATSFDEYAGVLNQFGIQVRVENKHISYKYPDRKARRDDTNGLGAKFSKSGLIEQFKKNYQRFYEAGLKKTPIEKINFSDHWKVHRQSKDKNIPEYRYAGLVIPKDLIKQIQKLDIREYGKNNGQVFEVDSDGKMHMPGREHVKIKGNHWHNEKAKTRGGSLEFINYIHQESWLETLKRLDNTGRVEAVQKLIEDRTPSFKAFYVPQPFRKAKAEKEISIKSALFETSKILSTLSKDKRFKACPGGRYKFISQENPNASLTGYIINGRWVTRKRHGIGGTFFSVVKNAKDPLLIFEDPPSFLSSGKAFDQILKGRKPVNVIVPLKPIDEFLNEKKDFLKSFPNVRVVTSKESLSWGLEGQHQSVENEHRSEWEKAIGIKFNSIEELLKDLILGRTL